MGKDATFPHHFGSFWAYSRALPKGVEFFRLTPGKLIILSNKRIPR